MKLKVICAHFYDETTTCQVSRFKGHTTHLRVSSYREIGREGWRERERERKREKERERERKREKERERERDRERDIYIEILTMSMQQTYTKSYKHYVFFS